MFDVSDKTLRRSIQGHNVIFLRKGRVTALASPYLKEILKSMSSYSPVIYLNMKSRSKLTAKKKKPPERRASNIAAQITISSDNLLQVQQYPPRSIRDLSDHSENNDNYETDYSIEEQHQSIRQQNQANIRNDAKFIIHQNENDTNLSIDQQNEEPLERDTLQNIPVIEIQSDRMAEMHTTGNFLHNNLQSQTDDTITKQHNLKNTLDNIDGFQITTDNLKAEQQVQTTKAQLNDYKIIVKTQNRTGDQAAETEALQTNMPVIEIQHIGFADQQEPNVNLQDQNSILPIQIDTETQPFQDNAILPIQTETTQDQNNLAMPQITRPIIKILDNRIIKSTVNSSGMDVGK
ncbi:Uncharacterized protein OBRU01_17801 [Operophtera brumata]|uniref:Uncharacterized protein n=1 Tax=Operophtera brumata TaxID=104452 RepID=A0A0L7L0H4_OPEBR|nr:Uncharacterized protein OBRU01_17801 [Operophtera brumata]